jgi:hypothetical protein
VTVSIESREAFDEIGSRDPTRHVQIGMRTSARPRFTAVHPLRARFRAPQCGEPRSRRNPACERGQQL